jgi:hypothetical protein
VAVTRKPASASNVRDTHHTSAISPKRRFARAANHRTCSISGFLRLSTTAPHARWFPFEAALSCIVPPQNGAQQDRFFRSRGRCAGLQSRAIACNAQKEASRKSTLEGSAPTQPPDQATCNAPWLCNGIREIGPETLSTNWPEMETSDSFGRGACFSEGPQT